MNYELADLYFKLHRDKYCCASSTPQSTLEQALLQDARSFLLTYEQICSTIDPELTPQQLVASFLSKLTPRTTGRSGHVRPE